MRYAPGFASGARLAIVVCAVAAGGAGVAWGSPTARPPRASVVVVSARALRPATVHVTTGSLVTWSNATASKRVLVSLGAATGKPGTTHASSGNPWTKLALRPHGKAWVRFERPGRYPYRVGRLHGVVVAAAAAPGSGSRVR